MIAVILSGGSGSRLWPVSREQYPKPFMRLADGQSLLQKAFLRAINSGAKQVLTVTGREFYYSTQNDYRQLEREDIATAYIIEPLRRNTAPAIALAALWVAERNPQEVMLVLPADQLIRKESAFAAAVAKAEKTAREGYLVTFGIHPTYPATGFGYIEQGQLLTEEVYQVERFVEKPNRETAETYLATGRYHWNAGIFCFQAQSYLDALKQYSPEIYQASLACWHKSNKAEPLEIEASLFKQVPSESVDYAVMEKSDRVAVIPSDLDWSDLGSWDAAAALLPPDSDGNRQIGEVVMLDSRNTFVQTEDRVVAVIGVDDLVIVDTPDALLISRRDKVQEVKKVVEQLQHHQTVMRHRTIQRPWGNYTRLEETTNFKIRRLVVRPGQSLTNHLHHHRSEHWTVLGGTAQIWVNDRMSFVRRNESASALMGETHQIVNPGLVDLVIIEVQSGEYLGEDDAVRLERQS